MRKTLNNTHIEGILYEHSLQLKVTGPTSKNPGTPFISGDIELATDNKMTNIVPVHFTYVTAKTARGSTNATYNFLKQIIDGELPTYMEKGSEAPKFAINSAVALNEFYSDRNGQGEQLVSVKRNEGGFLTKLDELNEQENTRATFNTDIILTGAHRIEANPDRDTPEKVVIRGYIFNFRGEMLPVEYSVLNPMAMDYFESLEPSKKNPVFTQVRGIQVSTTVTRKIEEEGAFGEVYIREVPSSRKEYVVTWGKKEPYDWDDESTITAEEVKQKMADRELYLAGIKQRQEEYRKAQQTATTVAVSNDTFLF